MTQPMLARPRPPRVIPLDPPASSPDPIGHYAATIAETAAMLVLVCRARPDCGPHGRRCTAVHGVCVRCAAYMAHLYIAVQHHGTVDMDLIDAAADRLHAMAECEGLYRVPPALSPIGDDSVFLLLMGAARTLAGIDAA